MTRRRGELVAGVRQRMDPNEPPARRGHITVYKLADYLAKFADHESRDVWLHRIICAMYSRDLPFRLSPESDPKDNASEAEVYDQTFVAIFRLNRANPNVTQSDDWPPAQDFAKIPLERMRALSFYGRPGSGRDWVWLNIEHCLVAADTAKEWAAHSYCADISVPLGPLMAANEDTKPTKLPPPDRREPKFQKRPRGQRSPHRARCSAELKRAVEAGEFEFCLNGDGELEGSTAMARYLVDWFARSFPDERPPEYNTVRHWPRIWYDRGFEKHDRSDG